MIKLLPISFLLRFVFHYYNISKQLNYIKCLSLTDIHKQSYEGLFLYTKGINPFEGDLVHHSPLILFVNFYLEDLKFYFYIALDSSISIILYFASKLTLTSKINNLSVDDQQVEKISKLVFMLYALNPIFIYNSTTVHVFTNFIMSIYIYGLSDRNIIICTFTLAILFVDNIYTFVLLLPIYCVIKNDSLRKKISLFAIFVGSIVFVLLINSWIMNSWNYIRATIAFSFFATDLRPNYGLFWYFFTEMFDHFRNLFLCVFQINSTLLYAVPLTLRLKREPLMLAFVLLGLINTFKSYPTIYEVSMYLSILPLFQNIKKYMVHDFIVFCIFISTLCLLPSLWFLWVYTGSANANFFFGATLAFNTAQIFLLTDLLFAYIKNSFALYNGDKFFKLDIHKKIVLE